MTYVVFVLYAVIMKIPKHYQYLPTQLDTKGSVNSYRPIQGFRGLF